MPNIWCNPCFQKQKGGPSRPPFLFFRNYFLKGFCKKIPGLVSPGFYYASTFSFIRAFFFSPPKGVFGLGFFGRIHGGLNGHQPSRSSRRSFIASLSAVSIG